ncbi:MULTISPECIES: hypothetical protein [Gordonia]|jgi:hypothetical protein|uniref:Uncharacterized protein n=1 Tax=Gordonia alkanivorans NBRC 16433 TaxID=1027371 RepID=F9VPN3_9ACTN|nr:MULTISPECIES: hypothetical protein [Gordonia]MDH3008417.1 hypothetical protein [Gordonia alkanivorans]MDH3015653.1 hypothetical protein [Gordonia alkanivorans]MDH3020387.1 hypothetical protein [Gordonia alkanivorans]MDH3026669.1 hypothetical protein [Gordonia alkanivorans]MDH3040199.1 hypothetical protein [Gordonia alkanivorans]
MNATQLDVLERVAIDELADRVCGSNGAVAPPARRESIGTDIGTMRRLVELGLVTDTADAACGRRHRMTPAGVEALAYLSSVAE